MCTRQVSKSSSMKNEIFTKRGLILILVIVTVVIFISLVWLIASSGQWGLSGLSNSTFTAVISRDEKNRTYPVAYWNEHPELYPPQLVIGRKTYHASELSQALSDEDQGA